MKIKINEKEKICFVNILKGRIIVYKELLLDYKGSRVICKRLITQIGHCNILISKLNNKGGD